MKFNDSNEIYEYILFKAMDKNLSPSKMSLMAGYKCKGDFLKRRSMHVKTYTIPWLQRYIDVVDPGKKIRLIIE